jgi:transcriptional regulator with XRE-family HTH domain
MADGKMISLGTERKVKRMRAAGHSAAETAKACMISETTVRRIERGRTGPKIDARRNWEASLSRRRTRAPLA